MTISFAGIARSLAPFASILKVEDWVNPRRMLAKASASNFHLAEAEFETFDAWWKLSEPARDLRALGHALADGSPTAIEVREAFTRVAAIANDHASYELRGYQHVQRLPAEGRFVVFSDHHMGFAGSRQDLFGTSGNRELYAEALSAYAAEGFTLVENGDVEELIIHEPMAPPPQATADARLQWRRLQLKQVIDTHRSLYEQINAQFLEPGRYIRIAGNHDQDLQDPSFLDVLREVYPKLDQVQDFLVLDGGADAPDVVIGHGHHFDTSSTPAFAAALGELFSECLGWAYEGADRVWRWGNGDGVEEWATGAEPYPNTLVTDDGDPYQLSEEAAFALATTLAAVFAPPTGNLLPDAVGLIDALVAECSDPGVWEGMFGNIAWEYFRSTDAAEAVFNEVFEGERWFKLRHLDELDIDERLETAFAPEPPYLVLGHSHEPRHRSWNAATSTQSPRYLNCGSAGRFENLLWGMEIIDGVPQVVAWHRPGGPGSAEAPERRPYTPALSAGAGTLVASAAHIPVPALDEVEVERRAWLAPVLQTMLL